MKKISVIVPYYNKGTSVLSCIQSIISQSFEDIEIIAIDDGSSPPLQTLLEKEDLADGRLIILRHQENKGVAAARNYGLSVSQGEYIVFLDSDDCLQAAALECFYRAAVESKAACVVGQWANVFPDGSMSGTNIVQAYDSPVANAAQDKWVVGAVMLKRDLCGQVPVDRMPWEMAEYWFMSIHAGVKLKYIEHQCASIFQDTPKSLSMEYNHFEPYSAGLFWLEMREKYAGHSDDITVFNKNIFDCVFSLHHFGEHEKAYDLYFKSELAEYLRFTQHARFSPMWFASAFGCRVGLTLQYALHKAKNILHARQ